VSATPHTPAKRALSYSTLHERSVLRVESILSVEDDVASPPRSIPIKRRRSRGSKPSPNTKERCVTRAMVNGEEDVNYDMTHHPMDDFLDLKASAERSMKSKNQTLSPLPRKRCITRAMVNGYKNVNYDMKHHPMDDILRPEAAKKRSVRDWASSASAITALNGPLRRGKSALPDDLENPLAKPILGEWGDLEPLDRRVYIMQRGAPSNGNNLPLKWPRVVSLLVKEQHFTREQLNTWGGIQAFEERYETVRVHMMALFGAPEEPLNGEDFVLRYSEGFDVYDRQPYATKGDSARPSSVDGVGTDRISHRSEDVADEGLNTEAKDNHYANNESPWSAKGMTVESDIDGNETDDQTRHDLYGIIQDYIDDKHDDHAVSQPQTAEIRPSNEVSLHASSVAQDNQSADKQRSSLDLAEHTDQKTGLKRGMAMTDTFLFYY